MDHSLDEDYLGGIISTPNFFLTLIFFSTRSSKEGSSPQGPQSPQSKEGQTRQEGRQETRQEGCQEGQEGRRRPQEGMIPSP